MACGETIRLRGLEHFRNAERNTCAHRVTVGGWLASLGGIVARLALIPLAFGLFSPVFGQVNPAAPRLPKTITGEACTTQDRRALSASRLLPNDQNILCDGAVVGTVSYALISTRSDNLEDAVRLSRPFTLLATILECEPAKLLTESNRSGNAILFPCRNKSDGWPILILATAKANVLRVVEGSASTYPVLRELAGLEVLSSSNTQLADDVRAFWLTPIRIGGTADKERIAAYLRAGRTAAGQSDFGAAENGFRRALELQVRLYGEDDIATNDVLMDLAMSVSNQGRHDEAEALLRRAAPIVEKSPKAADRARLAGYRSYIAANRGNFDEALTLARGATAQWREIVAQEANAGASSSALPLASTSGADAELAMALNLEAGMSLRNGDVTSAYASIAEAILIIKRVEGEPQWWEADLLLTIGNVSSAQGRLSAAETYLKRALEIRQQLFGEGPATLQVRVALGRAYEAENMRVSAIITFRQAIAAVRALGKDTTPFRAEDLIPFADAIVKEAETYDDPRKKLGLFGEAFDAFQMVRAPNFDRTLALTSARLSADTPELKALLQELDDALQNEAAARLQLATEQARPTQERDAEIEEKYSTQVAEQGKIVADRRAFLAARFPAFVAANEVKTPTAVELQGRLAPDEAMLVYLIGRTQSFVQIVTRNKIAIAPISAGSETLQESVTRLRRGLEIQGNSVNDFALDDAHRLYKYLFAGLGQELDGVKHLVIVPSGPLSNLPFGLLVTQTPTQGRYEAASWLINDFDISYSPSIRSFVDLRSTRIIGRHPRPMLALGDPRLAPLRGPTSQKAAFANIDGHCLSDDIIPPELLRSLSSLPDTGLEIATVSRAVGADKRDILLGDQASEAAFRERRLADYRILYFATHGLLPGELRCQAQPGIVLTPPTMPAKSRNFDGLLDASEIARLLIPADLVVLSACNTAASGKANGGDSLSGLAASFFRAGTRSLLVSHWQVPSAATTALMSAIFNTLAEAPNMSIDTALRAAQRQVMKAPGASHPFFWAAFIVIGDGSTAPLQAEKP